MKDSTDSKIVKLDRYHGILAWHVLKDDYTASYGNLGKIRPGRIYRHDGPMELCKSGLHASRKPLDALSFVNGTVFCRVACWGDVIEASDKLICTRRKVLWIVKADRTLHEFACWCAEEALKLVDKPDPRSVKAIRVKRAWLAGEATDGQLDAAMAAAWDAARDAAWDAARAAAWAAAWAAARDAARAAAWKAAREAAREAAWEAAWAARDAATGATWEAPGDAALLAACMVVNDLIEAKHVNYARKRMRVWEKGYNLVCDVGGILYVSGGSFG
jgi:hypothetical protein